MRRGAETRISCNPKFLNYKGFKTADISDCEINLMCLPLVLNAEIPRFKECGTAAMVLIRRLRTLKNCLARVNIPIAPTLQSRAAQS